MQKMLRNSSPFNLAGSPFSDKSPFVLSDPNADPMGQFLFAEDLPITPGRFSPIVGMFTGRRNAGKTYTITVLGDMMRARYIKQGVMVPQWPKDPMNSYWKIISNYWTSFSIYDQTAIDGIITFEPWVKNLLLLMDELQTELLNRRAMSRANVGMSNFLTMIRKRRIDCLFTTQSPTQIDPNVLYQTDVFIIVTTSDNMRYISLYCFDWQGQWTGNGYTRRDWPPPLSRADWVIELEVFKPKKYFAMYNTDEVHATAYMGKDVRANMISAEEERSGNVSTLQQLRDESKIESALPTPEESNAQLDLIEQTLLGKKAVGKDRPVLKGR